MPTVDEAFHVLAEANGMGVRAFENKHRLDLGRLKMLIRSRLDAGATLADFETLTVQEVGGIGPLSLPGNQRRIDLVEISQPPAPPAADTPSPEVSTPASDDLVDPNLLSGQQNGLPEAVPPSLNAAPSAVSDDLNAFLSLYGVDASQFEAAGEDGRTLSEGTLTRALFAADPAASAAMFEAVNAPFGTADSPPFSPTQILNLQQNLVAAGYLSSEAAKDLFPGWYDGTTAKAYLRLLQDAHKRNTDAATVLSHRLALNGLLDPASAFEDEVDAAAYEKTKAHRYRQIWGQAPPPGYVAQFADLNPDEFEAFERAKDAWQDSGLARAERSLLEEQVHEFFTRPGKTPPLPEFDELGLGET